jgi:hypothetical protein
MASITYDDVAGIITTALQDGLSAHHITTQYVSKACGSGELGAISLHLKRYWTENAMIGVSASVMSSLRLHDLHSVISAIVAEQTAEVRAAADARAEQDAAKVAAANDELAFALQTNIDLQTNIGVRDREIDSVRQLSADAKAAIDRERMASNVENAVTYRENRRLMAELAAARAETAQVQTKCTQALSKLKAVQRERADFAAQVADIKAGDNESHVVIVRLQGALDDMRRERDAALSSSVTMSVAMPHTSVHEESTNEVNG